MTQIPFIRYISIMNFVTFQNGMGFDTGSMHAYVDLGDWSGSTCAVNPATCQQGKESGPQNTVDLNLLTLKSTFDNTLIKWVM